MSLRSQRPQNAPPPGEGTSYSNYRPPQSSSSSIPQQQQQQPALAPPIPSTTTTPTQGSSSSSSTKPPPLTLEQSRQVARTHFDALKNWLNREGALANATTRTNARDKLTRLTRQQFQELSTDVYDELVRRIEDAAGRPGEQPFLAVRPDFHPKRNQARQKLATLPLQRFKDLASDVYFELDRRYPEFSEEDQQRDASRAPSRSDSLSSSHNRPNAPSPTPPPNLNAQRRAPTPNNQPRSPIDQIHPLPSSSNNNNSRDQYATSGSNHETGSNMNKEDSSSSSYKAHSPTTTTHNQQQPPPPSSNSSPPIQSPTSATQPHSFTDQLRRGVTSPGGDELSPLQNQQPSFGNSSGGGGPFKGYGSGQHQSRVSEVSSVGTHSKFFGGYAGSEAGGRRSNELPPWDQEERQALEKQRTDYEYKLQVLQNRVSELERENEDAAAALRGRQNGDFERLRELEGQLREGQGRYEDQTSQLRMVQRENDQLQQKHRDLQKEKELLSVNGNARGAGGDQALRQELEAAEDLANELRGEVGSLVDELRQVNERCEDLQVELDKERREKEEKEREARDWKEKWQSAKTELRNIKATSQLFTSSINVERDYMPASSDGLINDTSIAAFQTSIDDLLEAARSKEPTSVISHARLVVSAVEKIDHDVQAISPSRFNSLSLQDQDIVNSLKAKINATLSNLMTASKNHATSFGVSPVSLLDAAASHLASTVVELVRILKIRRTSASGGHPSRAGSLDPSSASSARFTRDPLPPLHEDSASSYRHPSTSPPVQTRELSSATSPPAPPKSNGYVSGGVSSLVSSSTAGMRNALEAMGIASSSASRSSLEKDRDSIPEPPSAATTTRAYEEEPISSPQSDYGGMQQQQQYNSFQQQQQPNSYGAPYQSSNDDQRFNQYDQSAGQQQYRQDGYEEQRGQQYGGASENGYLGQTNGGMDQEYGSPDVRGSETNVDELKSYIENQTEAIVHSIQSLLSAIRSGSQGEQLNENLTQIITIVSSIVAISKDALPATRNPREGESILEDLTDHCDKLSEMQSETGGGQAFTKQTKQAMATASFGVAKSLKQLNGLFATVGENEEGLV